MSEQAKWYVIHTYSGYEAMVKDSLEKLIENNNLGDYIVDLKAKSASLTQKGIEKAERYFNETCQNKKK